MRQVRSTWTWLLLLPVLIFAAGCATNTVKPWSSSEVRQGKGGSVRNVDGIDIWEHGEPDRPHKIIAVIERSVPLVPGVSALIYHAATMESELVSAAKEQGGDGIVVVERQSSYLGQSSRGTPLNAMSRTVAVIKYVREASNSDVDNLTAVKGALKKKAYALVVGIEQYREKLPKADFGAQDAKTVGAYAAKVMGYPEENVVVRTNEQASLTDLIKYLESWLPNHVEKDSTVFVYFSGHGAPDTKTGDAYLVPYDGDPAFVDKTGYPLKRLYEQLGKLPERNRGHAGFLFLRRWRALGDCAWREADCADRGKSVADEQQDGGACGQCR